MSKRKNLSYLREKIMCDIQDLNTLLEIIVSYRFETQTEAVILTRLALEKGKKIDNYNEKIGKILNL